MAALDLCVAHLADSLERPPGRACPDPGLHGVACLPHPALS